MSTNKLFTGEPESRKSAPDRWQNFTFADRKQQDHPEGYLCSEELIAAVNVALELGMPLLLTGEPGCGKSRLADAMAWQLGLSTPWDESSFQPEAKHLASPIEFPVKSDTEGRDLFYRFDTLGRFHAANRASTAGSAGSTQTNGSEIDARRFVRYQGLGLAILLAKGRDGIQDGLLTDDERRHFPEAPRRSIVLIDEIDKAPRDVPNDLLTEIENLRFSVPELKHEGFVELSDTEKVNRPIVVITSNSERELPAAFLRRCVYFHLGLPPFGKDNGPSGYTVESIVEKRLGVQFEEHKTLFGQAISWFRYLRDEDSRRLTHPVSLAEFLDWLRSLSVRMPADPAASLNNHPDFRENFAALIKNKVDQKDLPGLLADWMNSQKASEKN